MNLNRIDAIYRQTSSHINKLTKEQMAVLIKEPISSDDIEQILGPSVGVMRYVDAFAQDIDLRSELKKYEACAIIFLYNSSADYGHWLLIFENENGLNVFDSYGRDPPDAWGKKITSSMRERLGQSTPMLLDAILRSGYREIFWNDYPLQQNAPGIETCGRWCCLRVLNDNLQSLTEKEFARLIYRMSREHDLSPDELVVSLIT